ncbi:hypothetical protein AA15669_1278 [Saccharibacter floricola DSM 15669]|uniref:Uncharacterized protein n=1 Tax=Saccharibacter floricola DSM 15669 TaxID=1123227 RepID=A0ABQ0NZA2_9PROT|nr:hypothetical protein AA15669_1278 [Saccharibacter floricola DSM 15669]
MARIITQRIGTALTEGAEHDTAYEKPCIREVVECVMMTKGEVGNDVRKNSHLRDEKNSATTTEHDRPRKWYSGKARQTG